MENRLRNYSRLLSGKIVDGIRPDVVDKKMDTVAYAIEYLVSHPERREAFVLERDIALSSAEPLPVRSEDVCQSMATADFVQTPRRPFCSEADILVERMSVTRSDKSAFDTAQRKVRRPSSDRCGMWMPRSLPCLLRRS